MKKYIILIVFILSGMLANSQTDIEIAKALIGKPVSELEEELKNLELEYYITTDKMEILHLFIVKENSVRHWEIKHSNYYRSKYKTNGQEVQILVAVDIVIEIFVRYRNDNINDLREFYEYEIPKSTQFHVYEKEIGSNVSHLKITKL